MSFFISTHYTLFLTIWEISYKVKNRLTAIEEGKDVSDVYYDTFVRTGFDVIYSGADILAPLLTNEINTFIKESYDNFGYGNSINTISE